MKKSRMLPDGWSKGRIPAYPMIPLYGIMLSPSHEMMGSRITMVHPDITRATLSMWVMHARPTSQPVTRAFNVEELGLKITTMEWTVVSWMEVEGI